MLILTHNAVYNKLLIFFVFIVGTDSLAGEQGYKRKE